MSFKPVVAFLWLVFVAVPQVTAETVPVEIWADQNEYRSVSMSRDGKRIAMLQRMETGGWYQVVTFETDDIAGTLKRLDTGDDAEPRSLFWANNEELIISFRLERKRDRRLITLRRYLAFNIDTNKSVNLLESESGDRRASRQEQRMAALAVGGIASRLRSDDQHILMWINDGSTINIDKVNIRTGDHRQILKGNPDYGSIGYDWDGDARTATGYDSDGPAILHVVRLKGSTEWKIIARQDARNRDRVELLGFFNPEKPNELFYVRDSYNSDTKALYAMDANDTSTEELIFQLEGHDVLGVLQSPKLSDEGAITGYYYAGDYRLERYYTDPEIGALFESIQKSFPELNVSINEISEDGETILFSTNGPQDPGTYYMIKNGQASKLISVSPHLTANVLSRTEGIMAEARDGYSIPTLVTIPEGAGPFPGIVMPHGGPWVRDYYGYDEWAQMLANQGYVVVQPDYRGSDNHGQAHWTAGDNEWGQRMQDDIEDSILHLTRTGLVDPEKMAIFGWSYGGYAAFVGATRENSPFNCSVAGAGISDIGPMRGRIGSSRFLRKYQEPTVNGFSPIDYVKSVTMPMLIVHGEDDATVPVNQSQRFSRGLKNLDVDYEYIEIKDMFHSPWKYEHNMAWYPELFDFFEEKCNF